MNPYRTRRERILTLAQTAGGALVSLFFVAPLLWMASTALKEGNQAFSAVPTLFFRPTFDNLRHVFVESRFGSALGTSLFTAISSTILALILGSGIAYPLARRRVPGQKQISSWILSLRIIPPIVVIIPLFLLLRSVGLTGSIWSLVIVYTYMNLPLTVWLMRGFFADMPVEIEEAAHMDGCSPLGTFLRITVPLTLPGIIATGLPGVYFRLERISFRQRPDRRRYADRAGRTYRVCDPG